MEIVLHDLTFPRQDLIHAVSPGTAAHESILVAQETFAGRHMEICPGDLGSIG